MKEGRPIGSHIRRICELLEQIGPASPRTLMTHITSVGQANMGMYCSRAVGLGLMTVDRRIGRTGRVNVYTVTADWRDIADRRKTSRRMPELEIVQIAPASRWQGVNSVFSISA